VKKLDNDEKVVFARKASGLVRQVSGWDALIYNIVFMAPMAVFIYGIWASVTFPGTILPITALMAICLAIVIGLFYAIYSIAMPRSGGDYVWVSRTLHPSIGFAISFAFFFMIVSLVGTEVPWVMDYALTPIYIITENTTWASIVADPQFKFGIAIIYYLISALIISRGAKATMRAFWISFTAIMIGVFTFIISCLWAGPTTFQSNFNQFSGMNYNDVINTAKGLGWPGLNMAATMQGVTFTFINFLGFTSTAYIAGEIKEVRKSQLLAICGAVIVFGLLTWGIYQAAYYAMGGDFIGSISYLFITGGESYPLSYPPFFNFLFMFITRNVYLLSFMEICWAFMPLAAGLTYMFIGTRILFAWAFDRVIPTWVSKVDRRYNSPYVALIAVTLVAIFFQYLWLFTGLMNFFSYLVFGWMIMQIITGISAMIFPFRRKDIFEAAPSVVKAKAGPVPILSILGLLNIIISGWLAYASMGPAFIGELDMSVFGFTIGLFVTGFIIYWISSAYHRAKGIPLELSFKEIPPE